MHIRTGKIDDIILSASHLGAKNLCIYFHANVAVRMTQPFCLRFAANVQPESKAVQDEFAE